MVFKNHSGLLQPDWRVQATHNCCIYRYKQHATPHGLHTCAAVTSRVESAPMTLQFASVQKTPALRYLSAWEY